MTWEELSVKIAALPPEERKEQALVFDNNEGCTLTLIDMYRDHCPEAEPDSLVYLISDE